MKRFPRNAKTKSLAVKEALDRNEIKRREQLRAVKQKQLEKAQKVLNRMHTDTTKNLELYSRKECDPAKGCVNVKLDFAANTSISSDENIKGTSIWNDENIHQFGGKSDVEQPGEMVVISSYESSDDDEFELQWSSDTE